jgi:uncharacterized protein YciI
LPLLSAEVSKVAVTDHFAFMKRQHAADNILFSVPTLDSSMGIYVIKADSRDEAVAVAAEGSMHMYKGRSAEVTEGEVHQIIGAGFKD